MLRIEAKRPTAHRISEGGIQIDTPRGVFRSASSLSYTSIDDAKRRLKIYDKYLSRISLTTSILAVAGASIATIGFLGMGKLDFLDNPVVHNLGQFFHSNIPNGNLIEVADGSAAAMTLGVGSLVVENERNIARRQYKAVESLKQEKSQQA